MNIRPGAGPVSLSENVPEFGQGVREWMEIDLHVVEDFRWNWSWSVMMSRLVSLLASKSSPSNNFLMVLINR